MAITTKNMTPEKFDTTWKNKWFYQTDIIADGGTFNSITFNPATPSILSDRWPFYQYNDSGSQASQRIVTQTETALPDDYKNGTDIRIRFIWTNTDTSGDAEWVVGVTQMTSGDVLSNDTDTVYTASTETATAGTGFESIMSQQTTFNGSTLTSGEPISIIIYREGGGDTIASSCYLYAVELQYQTESGDSVTSNFKQMTPRSFADIVKTQGIGAAGFDTDAGTFNSTTCGVAAFTVYIDRFLAYQLSNGANDVLTARWIPPLDYKDGTDLTVKVKWFPEGTSGGNVRMHIGLCHDTLGQDFGSDADTTYDVTDYAAGATADQEKSAEVVFTGTAFATDDPMCIVVFREGGHVNDTNTDATRILTIEVEYERETHGNNV